MGKEGTRGRLAEVSPLALFLIPEHASGRERGPRMQASTAWGHHAISGKEGERVQGDSFTSPSFSDEGGERASGRGRFQFQLLFRPAIASSSDLFPRGTFGGRTKRRTYVLRAEMQRVKRGVDEEGNERVGCVRLTYARIRVSPSLSPPRRMRRANEPMMCSLGKTKGYSPPPSSSPCCNLLDYVRLCFRQGLRTDGQSDLPACVRSGRSL